MNEIVMVQDDTSKSFNDMKEGCFRGFVSTVLMGHQG